MKPTARDLLARRQAEDERVIEAYANGAGRGRDLRPVRDFVQHVRGDIGVRGVITEVGTKPDTGEVWARYHVEKDEPSTPLSELGRSSAEGHVPRSAALSRPFTAAAAAPLVPFGHGAQVGHDPFGDANGRAGGRGRA